VSGFELADSGARLTYKSFDFFENETQKAMYDLVKRARNVSGLMVRADHISWIEDLAQTYETSFPFANEVAQTFITAFFEFSQAAYGQDLGTDGALFDGNVLWTQTRLKINQLTTAPASSLADVWEAWKEFVERENSRLGYKMKFIMVSSAWTRLHLEMTIVSSTVASIGLSVGITLAAMVIFTGNIFVALYTVMTTLLSLCTLFGFTMSVLRWEFGPIEAIGMVSFVGVSVDYILHLGHAYWHSPTKLRKEKVVNALGHVGFVIVGGAVTTAGASMFLWACEIYFFVQLGILLFANTLICCFFSLFFMTALLMVGGPLGRCGTINKKTCKSLYSIYVYYRRGY